MCYEERCPICDMPLRYCECANKSVLSEDEEAAFQVALEHLYLLSEAQRKHLIEIERVWEIGYTDRREDVVERLKEQALRNVTCLIAKTDGISDEEIKRLFANGRFE